MSNCLYCNIILLHKNNKFCSKSCAAKFNNKVRSKESREQQKITLAKTLENFKEENEIYQYTEVYANICEECDKLFYAKTQRRNCSKQCQSNLCSKQKNGIKIGSPDFYAGKPTKAYLKKQGKIGHTTHPKYEMKNGNTITLGSSWELTIAKELDSLDIDWIRPSSLPWFDLSGQKHSYFSDFYLPKYDIYLDPKNPIKIQTDKEKLDYFEDKIVLFYGEPKDIMDKVKSYL
jgi:hypothetical protein